MSSSQEPSPTVSSTDLFRPEALVIGQDQLWGRVIVTLPLTARLLCGFLLIVVAAALVFLVTQQRARQETVEGFLRVAGGSVQVRPESAGQVEAVYVRDGQTVAPGESLVRLTRQRVLGGGEEVGERLRAGLQEQQRHLEAELQLAAERAVLEEQRLVQELSARRELLANLGERFELERQQLRNAETRLQRLRQLAADGHVARQDRDDAEQRMLSQQAGLAVLESELQAVRHELAGLKLAQEDLSASTDQGRSRLLGELAALRSRSMETAAAWEQVLRSPVAGRVAGLDARPGQVLEPTRPLLTVLVGGGDLEAVLLVPPQAIGFVETGQPVRMRYSAYSHTRYGIARGTITRVERAIRLPGELQAPATITGPVYRVLVRLAVQTMTAHGAERPLLDGMTLQADIEVERRSLLSWVFDPILSLRGRL